MAGERLDLVSEPDDQRAAAEPRRPFLGVHFACCGVYRRIYRNHDQTAYSGSCPRCGRLAVVKIDPNGSSDRFFTFS